VNRVLQVHAGYLCAAAFALALALGAGGYGLLQSQSASRVDDHVVAQWRAQVTAQEAELRSIRDRSQAESEALGRQLAQVQARLMRMEALGQRVVAVADLDEGEFSFDEPAALGGPTAKRSETLRLMDLERSFAELTERLRGRETELDILESLLADEEYRDAVALEGRPVKWGWLSSPFGYRVDPITGKRAWHAGVDFAGKADSEVIAVASGVVTFAGERQGYGKVVEISHGQGLLTRYGHHASLLVETGQIVKRGDAIGTMGSTGRSTGPHVHFEVEHHGRAVNPLKYLKRAS
jgi:murein DD-endopeptidase MepM/ murein hydrolase activator NlpD